MRRGIRLGSVKGVEVIADFSLFIIAGLLTWSLYVDMDQVYPDATSEALLMSAVVGGLAFFGSVFLHELAHSLMAIRRGLTVNRIRLFIFGGVSEIEEEAENASDEFVVTLAGPAASVVIGVVFLAVGWPLTAVADMPGRVAIILGVANLSIAVFNLLPGLPLDGGRILRALIWRRTGDRSQATRVAVLTGRLLGGLLAAGGVVLMFVLGDFAAIWFVAVGWFLYEAASTTAVQERFLTRIEGTTVGDVMRRTDLAIDGDATVAEALAMHGWGEKLRTMPVSVEGRVLGVFGTREVAGVAEVDRAGTPVRDAMTVIGPDDVVAPDTSLRHALTSGQTPSGVLVVVSAGEAIGLLTAEELSGIFADFRRGGRHAD